MQECAATHLRRIQARAGKRAVRGGGQPRRRQVPLDFQQLSRDDSRTQGTILAVHIVYLKRLSQESLKCFLF